MFLDHAQRRTTVGRTPLDEWSARRRDLYLTTHDTHNRQISMPPVGFKRTISAGERPQAAHLHGCLSVVWRHSNWQMKRGQPRNRWQTQHPWRETKPTMAYTCCWCSWSLKKLTQFDLSCTQIWDYTGLTQTPLYAPIANFIKMCQEVTHLSVTALCAT